MKYLIIIPRTIWKVFFMINFAIGMIVLYPFFFILLLNRKTFPLAFKLKRFWALWITTVPGIFPSIDWKTEKEKLPQPCVYCANHTSYLDIVMSYIVIPNYFVFMGKQELDRIPLFRIFFKNMNILVDRKSRVSSHRAFLRAASDIRKGHSVFLFPEGGIKSNIGNLANFKNGACKLAIDRQVPIVPITFLNNWKLLQNGGFFKVHGSPGFSSVIVHPPISTIGMTEQDLVSLRTKVHAIIKNDLEKITL